LKRVLSLFIFLIFVFNTQIVFSKAVDSNPRKGGQEEIVIEEVDNGDIDELFDMLMRKLGLNSDVVEKIYNHFTACSYLYYINEYLEALNHCRKVIELEEKHFKSIDLTTLKIYVQLLFIMDNPENRDEILDILRRFKNTNRKLKPEAYIFLAKTYLRLGKVEQAEKILEEALRYYPNDKKILEEATNIYLYTNKLDKAIKVLKRLVKLYPKNPKYYYLLGRVYSLKDNLKEAEKYFLKSLEVDPKYDPSIQVLLDYYIKRQKYDKAEKLLTKLLEKNNDNIKLMKVLYFIYIMENKLDKAKEILERIGKIDPEEKKRIIEENEALYKKATSKEFLENLKRLERQNPYDPNILYTLGLVYYLREEYDKAEKYLKRAIKVSNDFVDAYELLLEIYLKQNRLKEAKKILKKLAKINPNDYTIYVYLANIEYTLGNLRKAIEYIKKAIDLNPKNSELYYYLAYYYDMLGNWDIAKKYLEKSIKLNPSNADALNYLGYSLILRNENIDRGIELVKKALKLEPKNPAFLDSLGWGYLKKGNLEKAKMYLLKAYQKLPNDPVINAHLGELYEKLGNKKKALEFYKKSLKLLKKEEKEPEPGITEHVKKKIKALERSLQKK